jgi:hypothetical protein
MPILTTFKTFLIALLMSASLTACKSEHDNNALQNLSEKNIDSFMATMAKDYLELASSLYDAAHKYGQSQDIEGFISYRNETWTQAYIEKKHWYEATYELNEAYLLDTNQTKPFELFSDLIYTGLNYKHSLQKNDLKQMQEANTNLIKNSRYMKSLLPS